jgi:4-carboxymuconolactone decarboxylase
MRLPPIAPSDLTDAQRPLFDQMAAGVSTKFQDFTTTRDDGAMLGPWNAWLHDPELGAAFWGSTQALTKAKRIPDAARQVAIIATGAHFGAAYEIYAHSAVARAKHAMTISTTTKRPRMTLRRGCSAAAPFPLRSTNAPSPASVRPERTS